MLNPRPHTRLIWSTGHYRILLFWDKSQDTGICDENETMF